MKHLKRHLIVACIGLLLVLSIQPFAALAKAAPSVALGVQSKTIAVGEEIEVTVQGKELEDLYGYEIRLKYDDKLVSFKRASALWPGMSVPVQDEKGAVMFAHTKLGSTTKGENGAVKLAVFTFVGKAEGKASIEIERVKLVDSKVNAVTLSSGAGVTVSIDASQETIKFSDTQRHWAREQIERAVSLGIVSGYPNGTFKPDGEVTRAEFTAMLVRAVKLPETIGVPVSFRDFDAIPEWARPFVASAAAAGVITGFEDGTFRADLRITRAQMAVMIAKAAELKLVEGSSTGFADDTTIPKWARSSIAAAADAGLVQGKGGNRFEPLSNATRAEALTLILRLVDREADHR